MLGSMGALAEMRLGKGGGGGSLWPRGLILLYVPPSGMVTRFSSCEKLLA